MSLGVYDLTGRRVRLLVNRVQGAGPQAAVWNGASDTGARAGAGVYLMHLETHHGVRTHKLVLLR